MKSSEIRKLYLDYFASKGHTIVPGSGLVPFDDPTLLFTSAGMVQFKKLWAMGGKLPYSRAATCQKCIRAGGKDSDIDKIGITGRHHTFFEMLGNFSFGDYFKKEAVEWAYEFSVQHLKVREKLIWVSYYEKDAEAKDIWKKFLPDKRIIPLPAKDNFWGPAGDTGPCGPCTELYVDFGEEKGCGKKDCMPGCECGRFLEFWNLVFPQYDKQKDGSLADLKRRGVDTGMGLERITRILQKTPSNYETDLFAPIIKEIEKISGCGYEKEPDKKPLFRITADHIRAAVFLIDGNILPSNEGRGYVLRRILRRAGMTGSNLGVQEPFLCLLSETAVNIMQDVYPSLKEHKELIKRVILEEEEKYRSLLSSAGKNFNDFTAGIKNNVVPGETAFKLYDTYGIPKDLLEDLALDSGLAVDWEEFDKLLEKQKKLSRFSTSIGFKKKTLFENPPLSETLFTGYKTTEGEGIVKALYSGDKDEKLYLVLDKTPFYPEKGGQAGDRGIIENGEIKFSVSDTQIDEKGLIYHLGKLTEGKPAQLEGGEVRINASVDAEYRKQVSINHTSTHLLHYALREVFGKEIRQAGSSVSNERLRFDFVCFSQLNSEDIRKAEDIVQEKIFEDSPVAVEEMSLDEAVERGAIALFMEKYGEKVRIIRTGGYHTEVCGGTHMSRTGEAALFRITGFSSIGQNLKRIEAVTYKEALKFLNGYRAVVEDIARKLDTDAGKIPERVDKMLSENERKSKLIEKYENRLAAETAGEIAAGKESFKINGDTFYFAGGLVKIENNEAASMISDDVSSKIGEGIVFIGNEADGRVSLILKVSKGCKDKFPAVKLMKEISAIVEGQGGGSPVFARGSGKNPGNFGKAADKIRQIIQEESDDEKQ
ncbi:MAG: alanine--tRNA ligase [Candidatus Omnitrophica bacterium]|nr:alanine--tRNA ligase [Candidatus Omnitrophota bacterium]